MRDYVRRLLADRYEVETAADGAAALAAVRRRRPDLVVSDVMMPGLDGFALLRELRGDAATQAIPVILLSARAGEESRDEGLKAGADDYLVKPFTARELLARVAARLEASRVRREKALRETELYERESKLRRRAEEDDRRKDQFLATLAHELRNPLAPISNALQLMQLHGLKSQELQWAHDVIDRQTRQLTRLVDDLLEIGRISTGKASLRKQTVELTAVVAQAVETSRPLIDAGRHDLSVTLPPEPVLLKADPARLAQVLSNLLNNAAKYTEPGGRITLTAAREGAEVVLRVRDTGVGIPPEMLSQVFDLFTQMDRTLPRSQGGLGIGLNLVAQPGSPARRDGSGLQRRPRPRQRVRGAAAGCRATNFLKNIHPALLAAPTSSSTMPTARTTPPMTGPSQTACCTGANTVNGPACATASRVVKKATPCQKRRPTPRIVRIRPTIMVGFISRSIPGSRVGKPAALAGVEVKPSEANPVPPPPTDAGRPPGSYDDPPTASRSLGWGTSCARLIPSGTASSSSSSRSLRASAHADEPKGGPPELKGLKFRSIGPAAGGRVDRACGVPGDPHTFYAAVSAGGVWKSSDGGVHWKPIFDDQPVSTIGSIAVAPSDPNVIYVGSGEANIRGNVEVGDGIYKSVDAGKTWKHVWKQEGQIGTIIVHPQNPDIAYAAVLGHAFGPNEERGVYRTTDGGKTWQQVLSKDKDTGASDVCFDPSNSQGAVRRDVAGAAAAVGTDQRRPRQRPVRLARRRRHLDAARPAAQAGRAGRRQGSRRPGRSIAKACRRASGARSASPSPRRTAGASTP